MSYRAVESAYAIKWTIRVSATHPFTCMLVSSKCRLQKRRSITANPRYRQSRRERGSFIADAWAV